MRTILFTGLLILVVQLCKAQSVYFNELLESDFGISFVHNVEVLEDGYILSGSGSDGTLSGNQLIKTNQNGENLDIIQQLDYYTTLNYAEAFQKCTEGYIQCGQYSEGAWVHKSHEDGTLDWDFIYIDSLAYNQEFHIGKELEDGSILAVGPRVINSDGDNWPDYSELLLAKLNSSGELIWMRIYTITENEFLRINGIFELENGEILLSGSVFQDWDNILVKINSEGYVDNLETDIYRWGHEIYSDSFPWLVQTSSSEFVLAYQDALSYVEGSGEDFFNSVVSIGTFNSDLMELTNVYSSTDILAGQFIEDFVQTPDSGFALLVQHWLVENTPSYIQKWDSEFNEEWMKYYVFSDETNFTNDLYDIEVTPDGGFICAGSAVGSDVSQSTWLLKLDACGDMEWQGCDTSTYIMEHSNNLEIELYPNPAQNQLTVTSSARLTSYSIHNLLGKEIYIKQNPNLQTQIDVSDLSSGVYVFSFYSENEGFLTEKFIIE